jgi:hypothetical protein
MWMMVVKDDQSPVHWVPGRKLAEHEANHSHYLLHIPSHIFMVWHDPAVNKALLTFIVRKIHHVYTI